MVGNCRDCKHWDGQALSARDAKDRDDWYARNRQGFGVCGRILEEYTGANVDVVALVESGPYADGPGELQTRPDFGCVLWEAKDAD